jgi:hypothetical protein
MSSGLDAPSAVTTRSTGPKNRSGSMHTSASPASVAQSGGPFLAGAASGTIASSGSTRVALHAGSRLAPSAAATEPTVPKRIPPQLTVTPAMKNSLNHHAIERTQRMPSGTPTSAPAAASAIPSNTTRAPTCALCAPTARSMASVRCRSATPMLSAEKTMNVAASIDTVPPM